MYTHLSLDLLHTAFSPPNPPTLATVYTQVTCFAQSPPRPNPQPLPYKGRGAIFKAPLRIGEGLGERSTNLCVHGSQLWGEPEFQSPPELGEPELQSPPELGDLGGKKVSDANQRTCVYTVAKKGGKPLPQSPLKKGGWGGSKSDGEGKKTRQCSPIKLSQSKIQNLKSKIQNSIKLCLLQ